MRDNYDMRNSRRPSTEKASAARERYEQAMVDADIEGLPRSPEIEAMIAEWDAKGIGGKEQIRRLKAFFAAQGPEVNAAE